MKLRHYATTIVLGTATVASADIVIDQIGGVDGSGIGGNIMASQDFEIAFDIYDVIIADNFSSDGSTITDVEKSVQPPVYSWRLEFEFQTRPKRR